MEQAIEQVSGFVTWEMIEDWLTFIGLVFMVVQFFKEMPIIVNIPTKYFTAIVAFILLTIAGVRSGILLSDPWNVVLYALSSIAVTFTANGVYDFPQKIAAKRAAKLAIQAEQLKVSKQ